MDIKAHFYQCIMAHVLYCVIVQLQLRIIPPIRSREEEATRMKYTYNSDVFERLFL